MFDTDALFTAIVSFASGVAVDVFSKWLCRKMKRHPADKVVINGNHISAETVQVFQIIEQSPNDRKR
jgi:hypothetical protein